MSFILAFSLVLANTSHWESMADPKSPYRFLQLIPMVLCLILSSSLFFKPEFYINGGLGRTAKLLNLITSIFGETISKLLVRFVMAPFILYLDIVLLIFPFLNKEFGISTPAVFQNYFL